MRYCFWEVTKSARNATDSSTCSTPVQKMAHSRSNAHQSQTQKADVSSINFCNGMMQKTLWQWKDANATIA